VDAGHAVFLKCRPRNPIRSGFKRIADAADNRLLAANDSDKLPCFAYRKTPVRISGEISGKSDQPVSFFSVKNDWMLLDPESERSKTGDK
jgi:hypothetical protein